jgi:DNA topoisomerase-2
VTGIAKLDDALLAGGPRARECTLILTEGDSAKTFAVSGLAVVGRERYGVFPLKGTPLNVRGASYKQLTENVELREVATILGLSLKAGQKNINHKALRYGRLMIMADQVLACPLSGWPPLTLGASVCAPFRTTTDLTSRASSSISCTISGLAFFPSLVF